MLTDDEIAERYLAAVTQVPPRSRWRHWKGQVVEIITIALDESTLQPLVVYREGNGSVWSRSLAAWLINVPTEGDWVPRFQRV